MKNRVFLIKQLAWTDFKLRYQDSIISYIWSLINPLLTFCVLYIVFSKLMDLDLMPHYQLYLLLGLLLWNYFTDSTNAGMKAITNKTWIITNMNISKIDIFLASSVTTTITLILNLLIFSVFFVFSSLKWSATMLLTPIFIAELFVLSFGLSMLLGSYFSKYRDLDHVWTFVLQLVFWLTPIMYPINLVSEQYRVWLMLNPMTRIITMCRQALIYNQVPSVTDQAVTMAIAAITLALGYMALRHREKRISEEL